eukprot:CAMPEP_0115206612 /NCGR_PEP_ID=MMETSP0270-20121206/20294_1 /TAXON_ID=71861 /ORGANISM="Scrippsiella trochoidea, Strain CCMP3099" /LENGTH=93 /DNA_ID=CAMNT_0002620187 /DNA_START=569 /DNA_END=850 /DNA_ORIENTATION=-
MEHMQHVSAKSSTLCGRLPRKLPEDLMKAVAAGSCCVACSVSSAVEPPAASVVALAASASAIAASTTALAASAVVEAIEALATSPASSFTLPP